MRDFLRKILSEKYRGIDVDILIPPNPEMGDYSTNLAFVLGKKEKKDPRIIARDIVEDLINDEQFKQVQWKIEEKSGFINFYISEVFLKEQLLKIIEEKENYGSGEDKKLNINLEFVSANPTGPITVHNIRAAPYGDVLANILKKTGYGVTKEYYINDAGNQVRLLGESVARRYLRLKGKTIEFPDNLYQGEYVTDIAKEIEKEEVAGDIDNFDELVVICRDYAVNKLIGSIKDSLKDLGVGFDVWFSEKELYKNGEIENTLKMLENGKHVYEKDGARWLRLSPVRSLARAKGASPKDLGEATSNGVSENDGAVLVKSDGSFSYLMGDIAYTRNKFIRGSSKAINIWGTDHHGDVLRLLTGVRALGYEEGKLEILLHQLVSVKSGGEKQKMSKRKGEFVPLDDLLKEVGKDAVRFFFLMKDLDTHMEFDVELAKEQSKKNPVFYIQYAYARLNQIFVKSKEPSKGGQAKAKSKEEDSNFLKEKEEIQLMRKMAKFPELLNDISVNYQVHHLAQYAFGLAGDFHNFYEKHRVVQQEDKEIEGARLILCQAVTVVLKSCLDLMGISRPKKM
ncbi:MAG: arginine--tRNA ligase [Candidatus Taylorbacteria bacterium]|nr:arginine--tRNA ligase [Candidatus Taylorbacteria bacterium]